MTGYSDSPEEDTTWPLAIPLRASVQLTRSDSDALRAYAAKMMGAIMRWEEHAVAYSNKVTALIVTGDGDAVIRTLRDLAPKRGEANRELFDAIVTTWRLALLTSPDMTAENLTHWLPEYAESV